MQQLISLQPIGWVESPRKEIEDDFWGGMLSKLHLDPEQFQPEALEGLKEFSHLYVLFYMNQVTKKVQGARRPRNNPDWPEVGIFAQRAKNRPNPIGLTCCKVVEVENLTITVEALDAIDQSPLLDLKPYMKEYGPEGRIFQPLWSEELNINIRAPKKNPPQSVD